METHDLDRTGTDHWRRRNGMGQRRHDMGCGRHDMGWWRRGLDSTERERQLVWAGGCVSQLGRAERQRQLGRTIE
jgi:hypothetical protein